MSLSRKDSSPKEGKIILGIQSQTMETAKQGKVKLWTEEHEAEFLERVRCRARDEAKGIIIKSKSDLEAIREKARLQGYEEGLEKARKEIEESRSAFCNSLSSVLESIQSEQEAIWNTYKEDLVLMVKAVIEKLLNIEMKQHRRESLLNLLEESLELVDSQKELSIRVHPRDAELLEELLNMSKAKFPLLKHWRVKPDEEISLGGVLVESYFGVVDNTLKTRMDSMRNVLDQLFIQEETQ